MPRKRAEKAEKKIASDETLKAQEKQFGLWEGGAVRIDDKAFLLASSLKSLLHKFEADDRITLNLGSTKRNEFCKDWEEFSTDLRCVEDDYPLHFAVSHGLVDLAAVMLDAKVSVEIRSDPTKLTPLHCSAVHGHNECAKLLLSQGADKEATEKVGLRPMHWAAVQGHAASAKLLLGANCLKEPTDVTWEIPLHLAAIMGAAEVVKVLLKGENQAILRMEIDNSLKVIVKQEDRYVYEDDTHDGIGERFDVVGSQDLIFCIKDLPGSEKREFVKDVAGEKTYLKTADGKYMTYNEAEQKLKSSKTPALQVTFVCGTAPNTKNISGWTPLHSAAYSGRTQVCKLLLDSGADKEVKSRSGQTPLDYARLGKHKATREILGETVLPEKVKSKKKAIVQ